MATSVLAEELTVYGVVRAKRDRQNLSVGQPKIVGAKVQLFFDPPKTPLETTTNELGECEFTFELEGIKSIWFWVVAPDRKSMRRASLNEKQYRVRVRHDLALITDFYSVTGTVKDWQGNPVAGAFIGSNRRPQSDYTYTDNEGRFELLTHKGDNLTIIYAVKSGAGIACDNLFFHKNKTRDEQYQHFSQPIELMMKKPQHLTVNVVNREGQPLAGCKIEPRLFWSNTGGIQIPLTYTTDEKGMAEIDWVPTELFTDSDGNEVGFHPFVFLVHPSQEEEQGKSSRYISCYIDVRELNGATERKAVLPYKSVTMVKIVNPFEEKAALPNIDVFNMDAVNKIGGFYSAPWHVINKPEFILQSKPETAYTIQCQPNITNAVFPTIYEFKLKNETEKDELAITLQRGTLVRVKLTDEVDGTAQWLWSVGDGITPRLENIQYENSIPLVGICQVIQEMQKKTNGEKLTELQFYLPPGKYELSAKESYSLGTKRISTFREDHIPAPPMTITWDENPKQFTITDEKEINIEFKILEKKQ
jgi:hypothetical protein